MELKRDTQTPESPHKLEDSHKHQLIANGGHISSSIPSGPSGDGAFGRSDSGQTKSSFQVVSEFPYQPIDLIEWVQLRVRALNNKVLIGQNGNPFTEYEMEIFHRIDKTNDKNIIKITRRSGDPEAQSNFELKSCNLRFGVKDLFQMIMFYCQSFTDDDIPDKLWQEAEYGITQQGNDCELEDLLNYKIFKNLEVLLHPAMRNFFEIGRDRSNTRIVNSADLTIIASQQAQNDDFMMNGRESSLSKDNIMGIAGLNFHENSSNLDRQSTNSMRWQSSMMP